MVVGAVVLIVQAVVGLTTSSSRSSSCTSGGSGAWPEVGEHQAFIPPNFEAVSTGTSHGNVRARLCVEQDADAVLATIPWRQRALINTCPPPPAPNPPPSPADPCEWLVYSGGYNTSNIPGPQGNLHCGSDLEALKAACCRNSKCASVSWIAAKRDGCCKPNDFGGWDSVDGAFSYVKKVKSQVTEDLVTPQLCLPRVIVRSSVTGLEVSNVIIVNATREAGTIIFEPEFGPGEYHAYYLPHHSQQSAGAFWTVSVTYPAVDERGVAPAWRERVTSGSGLPRAQFIEMQPRVEFHRFTDMEMIATAAETAALNNSYGSGAPFLLFPEDRRHALRLTNSPDLPMRWAQAGPRHSFMGSARRGEFYTFQIGVWAHREGVTVTRALYQHALAEHFTCINLGGVDETGATFEKNVTIASGHVNSLWFGVQIPIDAQPGSSLNGNITLQVQRIDGMGAVHSAVVAVDITVSAGRALLDKGDSDVWRLSRLRWLDSTIGLDNSQVPSPYLPIQLGTASLRNLLATSEPEKPAHVNGVALDMHILGRHIQIAKSGLPLQLSAIESGGGGASSTGVLSSAIELTLGASSSSFVWGGPTLTSRSRSVVEWLAKGKGQGSATGVSAEVNGSQWFEGYGKYSMKLMAEKDMRTDGVTLTLPLSKNNTRMLMGFTRRGGEIGKSAGSLPLHWKWGDASSYQLWIGSPKAGLRFKFSGPEPGWGATSFNWRSNPPPWFNDHKGGANVTRLSNGVVALTAFTGPIALNASQPIELHFELLLTPVRPLKHGRNHKHWKEKHYQVGYGQMFVTPKDVAAAGATIANLHQGIRESSVVWPGHSQTSEGLLNPYIDWPFEPNSVRLMSDWAAEAKAIGIRTKFYYTVRELSTHAAELWALRSLGTEILAGGTRPNHGTQSGTSWLVEHLHDGFAKCWQNPLSNGEFDSAICDTGVSRWTNFYIEGLNISSAAPPYVSGVYYVSSVCCTMLVCCFLHALSS
jgi:hypothetical protein